MLYLLPLPSISQASLLQCCLNSRHSPSLPAEPRHRAVPSAKASKFTCTGTSQKVRPDTDNLFFPPSKGCVWINKVMSVKHPKCYVGTKDDYQRLKCSEPFCSNVMGEQEKKRKSELQVLCSRSKHRTAATFLCLFHLHALYPLVWLSGSNMLWPDASQSSQTPHINNSENSSAATLSHNNCSLLSSKLIPYKSIHF